MASFLSAAEKSSIDAGFISLHQTFAREIYVYVKNQSYSSDSSYHSLFGRGSTSQLEEEFTRHTVSARILYLEESKDGLGDLSQTQVNALMPTTKCRLKIYVADYELIKVAERIEIDGEIWITSGEAINEGPFSPLFKTVFLKRKN
jgi:hypothetical protein